jgi:hypothetical protein
MPDINVWEKQVGFKTHISKSILINSQRGKDILGGGKDILSGDKVALAGANYLLS